MTRYRIAFLTPEFPTEAIGSRGGLSNYLNRTSRVLHDTGHEVEVFTVSHVANETIDHHGIPVHRVCRDMTLVPPAYRWMQSLPGPLKPIVTLRCLASAVGLAAAFEARHAASPFHLVQSSDFNFPGLFVPPRPGLRHIVRCSLTRSWLEAQKRLKLGIGRVHDRMLLHRLERRLFHMVSGVYAPSRYAARQFTRRYGVEVGVVRPPFFQEAPPDTSELLPDVPQRYLLFVGHLNEAKGIDVLVRALRECWQQDSSVRMVWAGKGNFEEFLPLLEPYGENVVHLGPTAKRHVYDLMKNAVALVAPSRTDNLPNVVLEAVSLGTPVIGTNGASIDEIVEPGRSGLLVPMDDPAALASAICEVWNSSTEHLRASFTAPPILSETTPDRAIENLLQFADIQPPD